MKHVFNFLYSWNKWNGAFVREKLTKIHRWLKWELSLRNQFPWTVERISHNAIAWWPCIVDCFMGGIVSYSDKANDKRELLAWRDHQFKCVLRPRCYNCRSIYQLDSIAEAMFWFLWLCYLGILNFFQGFFFQDCFFTCDRVTYHGTIYLAKGK